LDSDGHIGILDRRQLFFLQDISFVVKK